MPGKNGCPMAEAVRAAYRAGEEDEAMEPRILVNGDGTPLGRIVDGDYCIFYDIRGEREIELTQAFTQPGFAHFPIAPIRTHWATMIQYSPKLDVRVAFPPAGAASGRKAEPFTRKPSSRNARGSGRDDLLQSSAGSGPWTGSITGTALRRRTARWWRAAARRCPPSKRF